jgi:hypothetical protein
MGAVFEKAAHASVSGAVFICRWIGCAGAGSGAGRGGGAAATGARFGITGGGSTLFGPTTGAGALAVFAEAPGGLMSLVIFGFSGAENFGVSSSRLDPIVPRYRSRAPHTRPKSWVCAFCYLRSNRDEG